MARTTNHVHVWRSILERAGFALADVPKDWEAFWSFWCEKVQPAVRRATGRNDIYAIGLPMGAEAGDTDIEFLQFQAAYEADYVTHDGRLVIDDSKVRNRLVKALDSYTAIYRRSCTPPDATDWDNTGNNKAFLEQRVVMVVNDTLSIPGALRATRPEDYMRNAVTIQWPDNTYGRPLAIFTGLVEGVAFASSEHGETVKEFVRFMVGEGWLAHWLDFTKDRLLPPMPKLLEQPFWLEPGDPHRIVSAMQFLTRPRYHPALFAAISGNGRHRLVWREHVWAKAVHHVAAEGISPEQAVDEAIARIKQLLSE
jgi:multiple sugar transport system substrate-binding protein